jgi:hypothetical protein
MATDVFGGGFLSPGQGGALALAGRNNEEWVRSAMARAARGDYSFLAEATPEQLQAYQTASTQKYSRDSLDGLKDPNLLTPPPSLQQLQQGQTEAQRDAKYGSDMSWLDPSFQYTPDQLGQSAGSQAYADPTAIAAQNSAMTQAQQFANSNLQFQSPDQQNALMQQWAGVQSGQGAPTFLGNGQQQALMQGLLGVKAPQFAGAGDQRAVLNQAMGMASNTGPGSLQFDTSGRQGEQYGNLQDIIKGGGATAIEMADRQRARADSESWLRGQREADMADYAERGLTGSGMELLNLSSDRQAAAGRNSQADLDMAKALEERRLGAINSAAGLATNMRGQTVDEQGLLNNRATSGLSAATGLVNNMRSSDIQEQLGLNSALQSQFTNAAGIAGTMRGQDTAEKSYLDQRAINALTQQSDMSTKMRDQLANESIANQSAKQAGLNTLASTSSNARNSSAQESQYRATAADDFTVKNNAAINKAKADNTGFLQDAYQAAQNNRTQTYLGELGLKASGAQNYLNTEVGETKAGNAQGLDIANLTAEQINAMLKQYQNLMTGQTSAGINDTLTAGAGVADATGKIGAAAGKAVDTIATTVAGGAGGGGMGAALGGASAGGGTQSSFLPTNYSLDNLKKK